MKVTREQVLSHKGLSDGNIAKIYGVSRQWVYALRTGYRSPRNLHTLLPLEELKILTNRKKESLGLPTGIINIEGGRDHRRELVRMRDGHTCKICKKVWNGNERRFDVHHIDEDATKTRQIDSFEEFDNLVTLCHRCHLQLHHGLVALS